MPKPTCPYATATSLAVATAVAEIAPAGAAAGAAGERGGTGGAGAATGGGEGGGGGAAMSDWADTAAAELAAHVPAASNASLTDAIAGKLREAFAAGRSDGIMEAERVCRHRAPGCGREGCRCNDGWHIADAVMRLLQK